MHYRASSSRLDLDETIIRPLTADDLTSAHRLSIEVGWPHRPRDWRLAFDLGQGFVACDGIGRILGTAMWWPLGEAFAAIGMVIVSPRLQARGAGRRLMEAIQAATAGRNLRLNSTREGHRLYLSLDFEPVGSIFQHQGIAKAPAGVDAALQGQVHAVERADWPEIAALDARSFGADRSAVYEKLSEVAQGTLIRQDGRIAGFALCRPFGRGHVVGPVLAPDDAAAIALAAPHVQRHAGKFLRADTPFQEGAFAEFLDRSGLANYDKATTMVRGAALSPQGPALVYGCVSQALG